MSAIPRSLAPVAGLAFLCFSAQTSAATIFSDNFNDGNADGWAVAKDGAGTPEWQVASGGYRQNNRLRNFTQSYLVGTYAFYQSGISDSRFTDYQLSARITPGEAETVGLMFRYKSNNNYYRFSINKTHGFSRLEKKVSGSFKTLAFNGIAPDFTQSHDIAIEVKGSNILVYLDGDPLFGAVDSSLTSGSVALFTQGSASFDDVLVETLDATPKLIASRPVSYFVDTGTSLDVAAVARNVPAGGGVRFTLDNGPSIVDTTSPYTGKFSNVTVGDHLVQAVIVDKSKLPLAEPLASDTNNAIGGGGRYFVAMGDSITNGTGDDIASDDASSDGRNVGRGFTPILNDLLSTQLGRPVTVMNEGLGGTTAGKASGSGASRVASTIARHAESKYWLIMFGTNDSARSVPSGKGLSPGQSGYSGSFKDSMQQIITSLKNAGKVPILAKVPFRRNAFASVDQRVRDYNVVIDELVVANAIAVTPPDFYTFFKQNPQLLPDNVHPNGLGYQAMAQLWFDALAGSGLLNQ
jgi:lysophospholipase L1-like esterase